ncbi:hypothetical protein [Dactylosporangium sp. NPDC049140]|uniref:hypothetical protein n=1 Tax=Dactylosporangium sp. NPDC049140 TaxID=3155647 RepID=UPI0033EA28DA
MRARGRRVASRPDTTTGRPAPRRPALPAGQLYAMVLAHLRAHPTVDFSPGELANVLDRPTSRGAIIKICRRLVDEALAVRTTLRPERYQAAPTT